MGKRYSSTGQFDMMLLSRMFDVILGLILSLQLLRREQKCDDCHCVCDAKIQIVNDAGLRKVTTSRLLTTTASYKKWKRIFSSLTFIRRVKAKRIFVQPNSGFTIQLRLFHKMGWKIDPIHEKFKMYRMRLAADKMRKAKILPQSCMDLVKSDPALTQSKPEPIVYRCKKCRRIVVAKSNLITHTRVTPPAAATAATASNVATVLSKRNIQPSAITTTSAIVHATNENRASADEECELETKMNAQLALHSTTNSDRSVDMFDQHQPRCREILFIEPLAWMVDVCKQTQGKLNCPQCQSKLGSFSWINGCVCPCGKNVSPAFYLVPSKVELSHSVKNVEITV